MKKNLIMARIAILALGAGALCLATTSSALPSEFPPLKTGANTPAAKSPAPAQGAAKAGSKLSAADKTFMMNAAKGGMMEVEWGKLAAQNGQNADVKKFGQTMVDVHTKANDELKTLASTKGVDLTKITVEPETLKAMPLKLVHRRTLMPLSRQNGTLIVATGDPFDVYALDELQTLTGLNVQPVLASPREIARLIKQHFGVGGETVTAMMLDRAKDEVELLEEI